MKPLRFPQPGEQHNPVGLVVEEQLLMWLVSAATTLMVVEACADQECEACVWKRAQLHAAYAILTEESARQLMAESLRSGKKLRERWSL